MNSNDLLDIIGDARDSHVLDAVKTRNGAHPEKKQLSIKRVVLIAAVVALALLLVGCTVAYVLSMQKLKIAEEPGVRNFNVEGTWVSPTEVTQDIISIRGYPGSSNQLATQEWYEFEKTYDPGHELMADENVNGIPDNYYFAYNCYTWEMVDKVNEIADKYTLKLLSPETVVQRWQIDVMFDVLGIDGVCHEEKTAKINEGTGIFYPEGNFKYEFDFYLPLENGELSPPIPTTVFYTKKDYFDPDYQSIDTESYEQWNYTTSDGNGVLIAMSSQGGYFFAENEDAFMTVSVQMAATFKANEAGDWNRQCMEQAAEAIDFSLKLQTPDMTGIDERLAQADAEYEETKTSASNARREYATYAAYIAEQHIGKRENLIGTPYIRNYYALLDVTGDGQEELLLGQDNSCFNDIFTIRDGKVVAIEWGCYLNLCEDGVIRRTSYFPLDAVSDDLDNPRYYGFGRIEKIAQTGKERRVTFLGLNCNMTTREWTMTNEETGEETPVSQEEVDEILSKYPLVDIEMKSIFDFPS